MYSEVLTPGEALLNELNAREWTQVYLSELTGFTTKHISSVITDNGGIGVKFALALEDALGISAEFWMRLEADHKVRLARTDSERSMGNS